LDADVTVRSGYDTGMVAKPPKPTKQPRKRVASKKPPPTRQHLYLEAWMVHLNVTDEELGDRLGRPRQTVYRWRTEETRLDPSKIAEITKALGILPADLWRKPPRRSIDAIVDAASDDDHAAVLEFVTKMIKPSKASA
jgi:transcriptional regulator with XRE-family HTH domain